MDVISVYRTRIDHHLFASSYLAQQLSAPLTYVTPQNLIPILRRPYQVVFAVPDRMTSSFVIFHDYSIIQPTYPSPKGEGFADPLSGTLNFHYEYKNMKPIKDPPPPPIGPGNTGEAVTNLQDALLFLLEKQAVRLPDDQRRTLQDELRVDRVHQVYCTGTGTGNVVMAFRQQLQVGPGELVDEPTAKKLNELLQALGAFDPPQAPQAEWMVRVRVADARGPLNGIQVSVFDRDLLFPPGRAESKGPGSNCSML